MSDKIKCGCGKGYASPADNLCKHCREYRFSRAQCVKVGVKHRGDGMTLDQAAALCGGVYPPHVVRFTTP